MSPPADRPRRDRLRDGAGIVALILLAAQGTYYGTSEWRERTALRALVAERVGGAGAGDRLQQSTALAFAIPRHPDSPAAYGLRNPLAKALRPSAYQIYENGGHCTGRSRLLIALLAIQGVPARKLYLYEPLGMTLLEPPRAWVHVVVEVRVGDRWVVADPLFNIVFRHPDGSLVTAQELSQDPGLLAANRRLADERYDNWEDPLYTYAEVRRFPWFAIPVVGVPLREWLVSFIPARRVDAWVTPPWLERPQLTIGVFSWALATLIGAALWLGRRRARS